MTEAVKKHVDAAKLAMDQAVAHLQKELLKIRAGKASPQMLDSVKVDYYGNMTPLDQVGAVNTPDPRQIVIQPWEKNLLPAIEKAILAANLGFTPQNTGDIIRINIPPLTEERRKELVKMAKAEGETAKVSIRNSRRDANDAVKKLDKEGVSEDEIKSCEKEIQELTDKYISLVDKQLEEKEKDILTV